MLRIDLSRIGKFHAIRCGSGFNGDVGRTPAIAEVLKKPYRITLSQLNFMKTFFTGFACFFILSVSAQLPGWIWATSTGGGGMISTQSYSVATDHIGGVYKAGSFGNSTDLIIDTTTLMTNGISDVFIAKYNSAGNLQWAQSAGGPDYDEAMVVVTDVFNNVYLTGYFASPSITFGNFTLVNSNTTNGFSDIFLVKFDPAGNVLWARSYGSVYNEFSRAMCVDSSGNVFIAGSFTSSTLTFDSIVLVKPANNIGEEGFVAKIDSAGNTVWAKAIHGISSEVANSLSADRNGNLFVGGTFHSPTMTFGPFIIYNQGNTRNVFIGKYDINGNELWANAAGGAGDGDHYLMSLCADTIGNVYVTGGFEGSVFIVGTDTLFNSSPGTCSDIYLVKYSGSGNPIWAKMVPAINGAYCDYGLCLRINNAGDIFLSCTSGSASLVFGPQTISQHSLFIALYDSDGIAHCATALITYGFWNAISIDDTGNIYLTGNFENDSVTSPNSSTVLMRDGLSNTFLAKYNFNCLFLGLDENEPKSEVKLFPNPVSSNFTIRTISSQPQYFSIFDLTGKLLQSGITSGSETTVDVELLSDGIYFLQVGNESNIKTLKFVKAE